MVRNVLMAGDDAVQRPLQGVADPASPCSSHATGHRVGQVGLGIELGQEPQALLGEGQRQRLSSRGGWHDGRQLRWRRRWSRA
ncbi:hypothetical protein [Xanthomonas translucens]|uniref:hypothetical protein n=1 Tax=Xanthomonas campestris pv. translucens TaxID=343 RepID=UPI001F33649D|nr:hypothetical protein [Xanthomonas translucens]UKE59830.1 hypothetical protein KFS86_09500 [Xanthomonas translucens pv. hordei]